MGFAYLNMNKLPEAEDAYSNALRLDSGNQSYKDNLDAVKEKISAGPNVMAQGESWKCSYSKYISGVGCRQYKISLAEVNTFGFYIHVLTSVLLRF